MILGITGTVGAGKGTVVEYLVNEKGFKHFSSRDFIVEEIRRRGLTDESRVTMRNTGNELRKEHGPSYIAETLLVRAKEAGGDAIIESIRSVGEAEFLKKQGGYIVAVDADKKIRYERVIARGSSTDNLTFEEFCEQEDREMTGTALWDMNVFGVMGTADVTLTNNDGIEKLHEQIEQMLERMRRT